MPRDILKKKDEDYIVRQVLRIVLISSSSQIRHVSYKNCRYRDTFYKARFYDVIVLLIKNQNKLKQNDKYVFGKLVSSTYG